ncbi:MAG: hypothetical protein N2258_02485 [Brevinematales bacterium]|nr:hypothetical protein [Brevinematales bacterium]
MSVILNPKKRERKIAGSSTILWGNNDKRKNFNFPIERKNFTIIPKEKKLIPLKNMDGTPKRSPPDIINNEIRKLLRKIWNTLN